MKTLTKQQAIEEHRKMWNWIAKHGWEELKKYRIHILFLKDIKRVYIREHSPYLEITNECFCCEYAKQRKEEEKYDKSKCYFCPLNWKSKKEFENLCYTGGAMYQKMKTYLCASPCITKEEFKSLALEIANLPERE